MTGTREKLWKAKKKVDFESEVLEKAHKLSKKEMNDEIDCRIELIENPKLISGIDEEEKKEVLSAISKEATVLALMYLDKYRKTS